MNPRSSNSGWCFADTVGVVVIAVLVLTGLGVTGFVVSAQEPVADALQVSKWEAHVLRVENARLRAQIGELRAQLDSLTLSAERSALEKEFRDILKPHMDAQFDWSTGKFVKK